ncbi:ROK family protein [Streptomyces sp. NPDC001922]|uniref:ROK family protein n=1 Tax=Streptomyces sp. NPDC001922 TaxID=3364624 RepID=UPI00368C99D1
MKHVIALDVGGTAIKAALVAADGTPLHEDRRPTGRDRGPDSVVASVLDFAAHLRDVGLDRYGEPASAAGVAVPGLVDEPGGIARYSANLGWRDVPLRALLTERLSTPTAPRSTTAPRTPTTGPSSSPHSPTTGPSSSPHSPTTGPSPSPHEGPTPVALAHDVRTGGLAEGRLGAGRGADRFLFVPLGTGIAAAIGIDGRIESGTHGRAGELGHVVVRPGGLRCGCGRRGCLETLASATAVSRAWAEAGDDPSADAADCVKAVESGDPRAADVWNTAVDALADGLVTAVSLLAPRTLIIGGGLARAGRTLFAPLRAAVEARLTFQHVPHIVPAALGDTAGCLGAGLLAWDLLTAEVTA